MKSNANTNKLNAIETIKKKLIGKTLTYHEIFNLMDEIAHHKMGDILTTYFVASSFQQGFSEEELYHFTKAMVETGKKIKFDGIVADKHCIGGIAGTRTSMIIVPIIAAAGFKIPKLSSRAITSPAGTADSMETLAQVSFKVDKVHDIVEKVGGCIVWNGNMGIAPADDIIIQVEEPLSFESYDKVIVSIMAKKIAVSANHLILDIPVGATMKVRNTEDAEKIAAKFKRLAKRFNIEITIDINYMYEPAGRGVGPALEALDVLYILEQSPLRPINLEKKALRLTGKLLDSCFKHAQIDKDGEKEALHLLQSGQALKKFKEIIKAQDGDDHVTSRSFTIKGHNAELKAIHSGKISKVNNFNINTIARILGAPEDQYAGIYLLKRRGESIKKGEALLRFHSTDKYKLKEAQDTIINIPIYTIEK
ncbi:hypothetical protein A3D80_03260 [Candidatus Roizmanbacteria bacterium RIFCSPHIGHO2_02_FULL_40_13b]|uniref:Pyrimidine nucleoside phosphorylase C-terminal domain-containing protein n=1 Tax=Candidatus Roizmanbacteria bacterium RIFCSPHIGHO2_01_FULL_39_24 TaxID=1802032 RepID=A0A1F7GL03_9BACT|nr:MAG: hypothetical protein A2799_01005 [Candidatus Roizmanbacteria bacterium RIFCSPHIGHO2_01_FULL_39_24]OGK26986.1 MAG: hypothetical protein A3D80_03260 [Candidatus Roizmanbacteria bacterium RIFCSPHIGHO2_02_FULL_40_13b]OGK48859.1 MAG: hypothetical protein A3A56_01465 [Candidatus Roizmanbacteria bacterium RIFCSPLOWO2_01_FULL_40_32]OGK57168.1 MAG: hypothetical protein A3H83_00730 [Candidatus Roizmanbacteria bacterium RIFCSPLOWO2_02_FULL_39_8]